MNQDNEPVTQPVIKRVTIVLPTDVHALGKELAKSDHRDFSGQVAALIEAEAKRKKEGAAA